LGNNEGTEVANLHAGWRGLANGIVESTVTEMKSQPTWAWLGAAISQPCFEVGVEVRKAFCEKYSELESAFMAGQAEGKYQADLYAIARFILNRLGVETVLGAKGWQNAVAALYNIRSIPQNLLLDPEGKIVAKNLRGEELLAKLKEILK
jgi:copper oxidase (laccase) domain-containing protein